MQNRVDTDSKNSNAEISNRNRTGNSAGSNIPLSGKTSSDKVNGVDSESERLNDSAVKQTRDMKPASDYDEGANDAQGEDALRSREKADSFQKK